MAAWTRRRNRISRRQMARWNFPPAVVFGWRTWAADYEPDEYRVLLSVFSWGWMEHRYVAEYAGELVCEQEQQRDYVPNRFGNRQGDQDWSITSKIRCAGPVHAGSS